MVYTLPEVMRIGCSLIGLLLIAVQTVVAQPMRSDTLRTSVYFAQGFSTVVSETNRRALDRFVDRLCALGSDAEVRISSITVDGWASPEGVHGRNERLSVARARNTMRYLADRAALPDTVFAYDGHGVDWSALEASVACDPALPARDQVLRILRETPLWIVSDGRITDGRKRQLGMLRGGRPYEYMAERLFPALRRADVCAVVTVGRQTSSRSGSACDDARRTSADSVSAAGNAAVGNAAGGECEERGASSAVQADAVTPAAAAGRDSSAGHASAMASVAGETAETERTSSDTPSGSHAASVAESADCSFAATKPAVREPRWALKTNLLYDALLIPNLGIEYRFARRWTVSADYMHAWWSRDDKHRYWRCYGGEVLLRRYLGNRPFTGHHIGLYGTMLTYDFEFGGKGRQSDGFGYGGGFEYGYSLPVGRRLNIDFSIGIGYFGGRYKEYVPMDGCYVWQSTRRQHWFGPTRAEIGLVWLLGGDRRCRKGGVR